ncbi:MAG: diaminopimelate decarboxylase [Candidatus Bathyarchaeota archaeon]|nr:diaminopimelate decarboxylase [Candidatus Bathyarchaeota archaeon]
MVKKTFPHEGFKANSLGRLTLDGYDLVDLAEKYGTPIYVISEKGLRENYKRLLNTFQEHYPGSVVIAYAVKANYTLALIKVFISEGSWFETFSGIELHMALLAGAQPKNIVLTGCNRLKEDFEEALKLNVGLIVVDSVSELQKLEEAASQLGVEAKALIRVNPSLSIPTHPLIATGTRGTKFGLSIEGDEALKAFKKALTMKWVKVVGIHTHIGSQILKVEPFIETAKRIISFVKTLNRKFGFKPEWLDFGGGFGIPYKRGEKSLNLQLLAKRMSKIIVDGFKDLTLNLPNLLFEPGRFLVGDAEILLAKVGNIKDSINGKFVYVDASTNHIIPVLIINQYYEVVLANKANKKVGEKVTFAGPLCFTGDILAVNRDVPRVKVGDVVAILNVGAYCKSAYSMHNAYPKPPTIMLTEHEAKMVQRKETLKDIISREVFT